MGPLEALGQLLQRTQDGAAATGGPLPDDVKKKLDRGRNRLRQIASRNNESWRFYRGDHYVYVDSKGLLQALPTISNLTDRTGKAPHRVRTKRNLIFDHVEHEVSAATQRTPSYDVLPSSMDPKRIDAALLAEKVALYLHSDANVPLAVEKVTKSAIVCGEGFAWPYFDNTKGKQIPGQGVATGEIAIRTFGPNEVFWEPGVRFEDATWFCIDQARSIDEVQGMPGFDGKPLKPDANTNDIWSQRQQQPNPSHLVMVTEYLERPSPQNPRGRWLVIANKRQVVPSRDYPCYDPDGNVCDDPVLLKLHYALDPDSDRDLGLVDQLKDAMRAYNDTVNKALEAKNLGLVPQILTTRGNWNPQQPRTDEPGAIYEVGDIQQVKWIDPPPPQLFIQLQALADQAKADMARIAAQNDIPNQVSAGDAIQVLIERDSNRRANFLSNLANFYAELMHRMLYLVQMYYTDDRLLKIRGAFGIETIDGFKGSDLCDEIDVRVLPESIAPLTREALEQKLTFYAQNGWISPEKAIAAIQSGTAEGIVQSYELQVRAEQREIQRAVALAGTLSPFATAQDFARAAVPIAKPWENHQLRISVLADYFATGDYENLPPEVQHVLELHYQQHEMLAEQQAMQQAQQTAMMAQQIGSTNAAKPAGGGPGQTNMPRLPSPRQQPQATPQPASAT